MIRRGTGTISRTHSKNYTSAQADARLKETVRPYQAQGLRALEVDSFEVMYFYQAQGTTICTCKQTEVLPQHGQTSSDMPVTLMHKDAIGLDEIRIDYSRPLFGQKGESLTANDETDSGEFDIDEGQEGPNGGSIVDNLFSTSPDCGICYRTGYVPGFNLYGHERLILTTHSMVDSYGYTLDLSTAPHTYSKIDSREGFVEFLLEVPRYYKSVKISLRNNTEILSDCLWIVLDPINSPQVSTPLTYADLKYLAGKTATLRVLAEEFTHVVIELDLGLDPVRSNVAQMSKTIDWTLFSTLGNLQLVLPMTIAEVHAGDIVFIPARSITLKVTDVTYLRTSQEKNLDWAVSTRVLQPQEALKSIAKGFKLG